MKTERRTLTIEEAAKALGVSRGAAYAAAGRGELPTVRIGKRYVVPKSQLEKMLGETFDDIADAEAR